jgi:hypothetical protein
MSKKKTRKPTHETTSDVPQPSRRWVLALTGTTALVGAGAVLLAPKKRELSDSAYLSEDDIAIEYANLYDEIMAARKQAEAEGKKLHIIAAENHKSPTSLAYEAMVFSICKTMNIAHANIEFTKEELDYARQDKSAHLNPSDNIARIMNHVFTSCKSMQVQAIDTFFTGVDHRQQVLHREIPQQAYDAIEREFGQKPKYFRYGVEKQEFQVVMQDSSKDLAAAQLAVREHARLSVAMDRKREVIMADNIAATGNNSINLVGNHHARNVAKILSEKGCKTFTISTTPDLDPVRGALPEEWKEDIRWLKDSRNARQPAKRIYPYTDAYGLAIRGMQIAHEKYGVPIPAAVKEMSIGTAR